ncbi:MAG TPA: right-handed parallel beta-helix repeat-containing protein, partial [Vicinamibacteria bacterium]
ITNLLDSGRESLAATTTGTTLVASWAAPTLTLSGSDTVASYQAVLRTVTYANTSQDPDPTGRVVAFVARDADGAGSPATKTVAVTPVNDAPVATAGGGSPTYTEDGAAVAVDPAFAVTDADDATLASATVTITNLADAGSETLAATTGGTAIVAVWSAPTLTLSGADTVASYQAVLRGVRYANASQDPSTTPRSIQFRANDAAAAGNAVTTLVGVVAVNDPPVLAGAGSSTFTEGDGPLTVAPALTVSDADHATLASATVTITNLLDAGAELLLADTTGTSITAAYAPPTLTLSGPDTVARFQAVLRTVAYRNSSLNPTPTTRSIAFSASDGTGAGATVATVDVVSVNSPPVLGTNPVAYATAGNTQLHVAGSTLAGVASIADAQSVLAKAGAVDPDGPAALSVVAASGATTGGGPFAIDALGSFTHLPGAGYTGTDSFTYGLTDGVVTVNGTVNVTVGTPVWYVRDVVDAQNPAGGDGRSTDAFETLAAAEAASGDGHVLFVFAGDTATTPLDGGIVLRNGQKLLGEGAGLTLPPYGSIVPAGEKPRIVALAGDAVSVPATAGARVDVEVRGLDLQAAGNAVDVTAAGGNAVGVIVSGNTIGAGLEGIDLNAEAAAAFTAVVQGNTIAAAANGLDARSGPGATLTLDSSGNTIAASGSGLVVDGSAGGTVVVNGFLGNAVSGSTAGTGILVASAVFDAVPGGSLQPVPGGVTAIGSAADGVGAAGLVLASVAGAVDFADLDVFADGGAALLVSGAGAFTGAAGTQLAVADGVATLRATGGPVVDVGNATLRLVAAGLTSAGSPTTGVSLLNVSDGSVEARLEAPASSSISGAAGTAFGVTGGNAGIAFAGSIVNTAGRAVAIASWAGDDAADDLQLTGPIDERGTGLSVTGSSGPRAIAFGGALTIRPPSGSVGFSASGNTNAGGLRATGTGSLIETTNAAALSVTSTTIGGAGLSFARLSADGGANGVVLANTGSLGGLSVTGSGAAGTGGTIQNMTGDGISLRSTKAVSLAWMAIQDNDGSGVYGDDVDGFSISDSTVTGNGDTANGTEAGLRFQELIGTGAITGTVVSGSSEDNVRLTPASGVLSSLVVSGSTIGPNSPLTGGNGLALIGSGSASTTLTVTGTLFQGNRGAALVGNFGGTGVHAVAVTGSTLRDNGRGVSLATSGAASLDFDVTSNLEIVRTTSSAIEVLSAADTPSTTFVTGSVAGNAIGNTAADSGSRDAYGIAVDLRGDERAVVAVTGNDVRHTDLTGVLVTDADFGVIGGPPSDTDVTVRDNAVRDVDDNSGFPCGAPWGTRVDFRHTTQGCLDMAGNESAPSPAVCPDNAGFRVRQRDTSTVLFERLSDGDATPNELLASIPVVEAHVVAQNDAGSTANVLLATGFTEAASGVCAKP